MKTKSRHFTYDESTNPSNGWRCPDKESSNLYCLSCISYGDECSVEPEDFDKPCKSFIPFPE